MAIVGDAFEAAGKFFQEELVQKPITSVGRRLGRVTTKLTGEPGLGQAVEGGFEDFAGGSTGDFKLFKKGFKRSFKGGSAFFGDLFDTSEPLDENPDVGDPFGDEGRQSARDPRRRGGGGNTILTSNSNSPSLLG